MGRPTKLTPAVMKKVVAAIKAGHSDTYAAANAGITKHSLRNWKLRGQAGEPEFAEFFAEYTRAREIRRHTLQVSVYAGAAENPDLALKALQVLHPREHGKGAQDREIEDEQFLRRLDPILARMTDESRLDFLTALAAEEDEREGVRSRGHRAADAHDGGSSGGLPPTTH